MGCGYVLVLDCGTQSMRSIVYDFEGTLIGIKKVKYPNYHMTQEGFIEMDADIFWQSACESVDSFWLEHPEIMGNVVAITLTSQRSTSVFVDEDGKPLKKAISWMDTRKIKNNYKIRVGEKKLFKMLKVWDIVDTYNRSCPYHWVKQNEKQVYDKIHKYLFISTYINFKLTGEFKDSVTSAPGYVPFNRKNLEWAKPKDIESKIFHVEREKLFDLVQPGELIGNLTKEAANLLNLKEGIPVVASGSDKACETLGVGCLDTTTASVSLGSMVTIETTTNKYFELYKLGTVFPAALKGCYNPELGIMRGFWLVSWFIKEFAELEKKEAEIEGSCIERLLNKKIEKIPPGSDGLLLQPYWLSDVRYPGATGTILGLNDIHTRMHFYRALIEGLGYSIKEGIGSIEKKTKKKVEKIALSGGGAQSEIICQILANIFNKTVYVVQSHETSGLGAALLGYVKLGVYDDIESAVEGMIHITKTYYPDKESASVYQKLFEDVYRLTYKRLQPVYSKMADLNITK